MEERSQGRKEKRKEGVKEKGQGRKVNNRMDY